MSAILQKLKEQQALSNVRFDGQANDAARAHNDDLVAAAEEKPAETGALAKLQQMTGEDREARAAEASFFNV